MRRGNGKDPERKEAKEVESSTVARQVYQMDGKKKENSDKVKERAERFIEDRREYQPLYR